MTHFYTETANGIETRHEVPMTSDPKKKRASRTTDAKKAKKEKGEIWYPSVTTVMDVLAKHALTDWKIEQHLISAFEFDYMEKHLFTEEAWMQEIKLRTEHRLDEAPKAGTDIHNVLEDFIKDGKLPKSELEQEICHAVASTLLDWCGEEKWETEKYFVNSFLGVAGCADLVSPNWVIDYKSKQFDKQMNRYRTDKKTGEVIQSPKILVYKEHLMQLAAYSKSINDSIVSCANIFICLETAEVRFIPHAGTDLEKGLDSFMDCVSLYHRNHYNPFEVN